MGLPMPHGHSSNEGPHSSDEGSGRHRDRHASHASTNSVDALGWTDDSHHTHPNVTENGCSSAARAKGNGIPENTAGECSVIAAHSVEWERCEG